MSGANPLPRRRDGSVGTRRQDPSEPLVPLLPSPLLGALLRAGRFAGAQSESGVLVAGMSGLQDLCELSMHFGAGPACKLLRDPNRKNHYSKNNYKKMRQMSEQARDKNA